MTETDPFVIGRDVMFAGPRTVEATYTVASSGASADVTLLEYRNKDTEGEAGVIETTARKRLYELRIAEMADKLGVDPVRGDTVTMRGTDFEVDGATVDHAAEVWSIGLIEPY